MTNIKKGLGKGLGALLKEAQLASGEQVRQVPVASIRPNRFQPRTTFDKEKLAELAASIANHGIIQPLIVRELDNEQYELVAGERRLRAAKMARLLEVPVVLRIFDDVQMHEIALIENLQREDLNPIEEAVAYRALMDQVKLTQDELAKRIGKSRSAIANTLRLLQLDDKLQTLVKQGKLSEGNARAILPLPKGEQMQVAVQIVDLGLTVRQTEKLVQKMLREYTDPDSMSVNKKTQKSDVFVNDLEQQLQYLLGAPVQVQHKNKQGTIEIKYFGLDDLERIIKILSGGKTTG